MATLANRNNNPGNIKDTSTGQFRVFNSPQEGYAALMNDLEIKKSGRSHTGLKPESTLVDFAKAYAPSSDNNNPAQYAANLANHMGIRPDATIGELDTGKWADAVSHAEGYQNQNTSPVKNVYAPQTIPEQRQSLKDNGQPVSVNPEKSKPSIAGNVIRGLIKPFAKVGMSVLNSEEALTGQPVTETLHSGYLGDVKRVGSTFDPSKGAIANKTAIKDTAGTALELGSYLIGGGEAEAGIQTLKEGGLLGKKIIPTILKGAGEGSLIGGATGSGTALQEDKNLKDTAISTGEGTLAGGLLGGVFSGAGSAIEKSGLLNKIPGMLGKRTENAKKDLYKAYEEVMGSRKREIKFAQKDEALGKDTLQDVVDNGIVPEFNEDGTKLDFTKGMQQVEHSNDLFGTALGEAVASENKQIPISELRKKLYDQLSKYKNTADETAIANEIESRLAQFESGGEYTDLVNIQDIKNKASKDSRGMYNPLNDATTSTKKKAAKEIFYATKDLINKNVSNDSPVKEINAVLERNHRMQELLDLLHGSTVKRGKIGKYVAETLFGAAGLNQAGPFGALAGAKLGEEIQQMLMKGTFGSSTSKALLRTLEEKDPALYQQVIEKIANIRKTKEGILKLPAAGESSARFTQLPGEIKTPGFLKEDLSAKKATDDMRFNQEQAEKAKKIGLLKDKYVDFKRKKGLLKD